PLETCLSWATTNGAAALGFDDRLGSFEVGKTPGLVLLGGDVCDERGLIPVRVM
nr:amidohydrolase family protein [Saprospiraceae bacterium]